MQFAASLRPHVIKLGLQEKEEKRKDHLWFFYLLIPENTTPQGVRGVRKQKPGRGRKFVTKITTPPTPKQFSSQRFLRDINGPA